MLDRSKESIFNSFPAEIQRHGVAWMKDLPAQSYLSAGFCQVLTATSSSNVGDHLHESL
jgi:hypothetical protein